MRLRTVATDEHVERALAVAAAWQWRSEMAAAEKFRAVGGRELSGMQKQRTSRLVKKIMKTEIIKKTIVKAIMKTNMKITIM